MGESDTPPHDASPFRTLSHQCSGVSGQLEFSKKKQVGDHPLPPVSHFETSKMFHVECSKAGGKNKNLPVPSWSWSGLYTAGDIVTRMVDSHTQVLTYGYVSMTIAGMYGKTYQSMYQGSMVGAGLNVFAVWNYIVTNTHFGVIELNPKLLKAILGGEIEEIQAALDFLGKPDPESRSKIEEGRRIVKEGQFQYRVVNWQEYQTMKNADDLREYNRVKQAEYRARVKQMKMRGRKGPQAGENGFVRTIENDGLAAADAQLARAQGGSDEPSEPQFNITGGGQ